MKHLFLLALLFVGLVACENDVDDDMDDAVEAAFVLEYPEATKVRWTPDNTNGYYDVVFVDKGEEISARYDRTGKRVQVENKATPTTTTQTTTTTRTERNANTFNEKNRMELEKIGFRNDIPMLESEVSLSTVSSSLSEAVSRDYRGWTIHKVKEIEQDGRKLMKFELKNEQMDKEVKPMYTMEGKLVGIDD